MLSTVPGPVSNEALLSPCAGQWCPVVLLLVVTFYFTIICFVLLFLHIPFYKHRLVSQRAADSAGLGPAGGPASVTAPPGLVGEEVGLNMTERSQPLRANFPSTLGKVPEGRILPSFLCLTSPPPPPPPLPPTRQPSIECSGTRDVA